MIKHVLIAGGFAALLAASPAKAHLVFEGPVDLGGTGLGAVDTILTMNGQGSNTAESGQVSWVCNPACHDVVTGDPAPPGYTPAGSTQMTGINHTITMSVTGWTGTQSLGIVFNPAEPGPLGGLANQITLNNLEMTIYNATTGAVLFNAPWLGGPMTLLAVDPGTGNSGYLFGLDTAETLQLLASGVTGNDRIGLLAYATNAQGGNETFFGTVIAFDPDPVPEPAGLAIFGSALLGLGALSRRRR